ncbi:signal transduction four helix bundle sensory module [Candidatus Magnetoovum chiemensis]|nr:signal transduction four helix bundle sensory module [Candidatus Magnetoovum chiemensis]
MKKLRIDRISIGKRFLIFFSIIVILSLSAVGFYGYISASSAYKSNAMDEVQVNIDNLTMNIDNFLQQIPSDIQFISRYYAFKSYLYWKDLGVKTKADLWHSVALDTLHSFLDSRQCYRTVRFVDNYGIENIKIQYDRKTAGISLASNDELQDMSADPVFKETINLPENAHIVSEPILSAEGGEIIKPIIPVIRFAAPIIGSNSVKYGAALLSVYVDYIIDIIKNYSKTSSAKFYLISSSGDYFYHPEDAKSWTYLLGEASNLQYDYKEIYDEIKDKQKGIFISNGKIISFNRIYPNKQHEDKYWVLVGAIEEKDVMGRLNDFVVTFAAIFIVVLAVVFIASRSLIAALMRPLMFVTRQLESLGKGVTLKETLDYRSNDEVRRMLISSSRLIENMEALTKQADIISSGDYTQIVQPLSEHDKLSASINNMTKTLRENEAEDKRQNWLKDCLSQLTQKLSGDLTTEQIAQNSINLIARYIESAHGVFYIYDAEGKVLRLIGSYMFTERDTLSSVYKIGEGSAGQCALERKPILLKNIRKQDDYITTAIVSAAPLNIYTYPLLYENELFGIIELASFNIIAETTRNLLDSTSAIIGAYLYSSLQKDRIKELLQISQTATERAEEQSRKLKELNVELEHQQQQLQQQTEELMQTNAQMEEQQLQLQQQTEELMQTNAQMEEQQQQLQQQTEELKRNNEELTESKEEIVKKASELERSNKYKSEFLANMSHELRTPLNSIILLSKMFKMNENNNLTSEDIKRAAIIHRSGEELLRLINDILDLSKIEAGKMDIELLEIHSSSLLAELKTLFDDRAKEQNLIFHAEDRLNRNIITDCNKLSQAVRNLLSNAFKYTKKGKVELIIAQSGIPSMPVKIAVSDTGIGIAKDKHSFIFEPFKQLDGSISRKYGGTGLGLSITQKFVNLLGGKIELESEQQKGSAFTIYIPDNIEKQTHIDKIEHTDKAPQAPQAPQAPHAAKPLPQEKIITPTVSDDRHSLNGTDTTILVIDDDFYFADSIADINKTLGYKTLIALNGLDGIDLLNKYRVNGILLDLGLPDIDGIEILKRIKTSLQFNHIPVYIVTARDKETLSNIKDIEGILQKPVTKEQIEEAELSLIKAAAGTINNILVIEGKSLKKDFLEKLIKDKKFSFISADTNKQLIETLSSSNYDLIMIDYEPNKMSCLTCCETIREINPTIPIIIYASANIDKEDETKLRRFTDTIIVHSEYAKQRLSKSIERFLHEVQPSHQAKQTKLETQKTSENKTALKEKTIMVVDDDARNLFVITAALEQNGAKVVSVINGAKALAKLREETIDLVFMDIMMPDMNGYETIENIRKDEKLKTTPIVALTAKALKDDREKCLEKGANDYLSKPVDYEILIKTAAYWSNKKL